MVNKFNHLNVPDQWNHYWSRYPQGYTILEALISWVSQVDSMVDNQNKLNDNVEQFRNEIDEFVGRFDERLQTEVTQTLNDWQNSGFLEVVISTALQWELDNYITTNEQDKLSLTAQMAQDKLSLTAQMAQTAEDVELAHSKIKRNNENTFGTYENAAVESIIANDEGQRPEVLGIRLEDDHILATYTNRDSVASYHSNRSRKPSYNIDNVTYTVNSVTVPPGIDLSKIKNGMIIDTKHNPKFSGFIVGVVGQKILINNWYEMWNTTKGQVPPGTTGILVDPMTTPFVDNSNLYLAAEDDSLDGVVFEGGIINEKADNIGKAFNAVSLGTKSPEVGFKTTGARSPFMQGFNADNASAAFVNSNEDVNGFLIYNEKTGYRIKNGGRQNKLLLEIAYASTNRTFDPRNAPIYLIDTPGIIRILSPSEMGGAIVYVLNILPSEILMEWSYWKPDDPGSIRIPAQGMKILVSDGNSWYHF